MAVKGFNIAKMTILKYPDIQRCEMQNLCSNDMLAYIYWHCIEQVVLAS